MKYVDGTIRGSGSSWDNRSDELATFRLSPPANQCLELPPYCYDYSVIIDQFVRSRLNRSNRISSSFHTFLAQSHSKLSTDSELSSIILTCHHM
jgi:hypothetical protein